MSEDNLLWWPKPRFTEARFRPYVAAIGQASLAWNELHEHLGRLFCYLVPAPSRNLPLALWQSQRVDRSKRELMKAALAAIPPGDNIHVQRPLLRDDLEWLLGRVEAMEEPRNNTVHAPLQLMLDMGKPKAFNAQTRIDHLNAADVVPLDLGGNSRALKLAGKTLLVEFRWCRDSLLVLRDFTFDADMSLTQAKPWPDRPKMPVRQGSTPAR